MLIQTAYDIEDFRISGGPSWIGSDRYDIRATADGNPTKPQLMQMLRRVLEDRFRLKVHEDPRDGTVYELRVAKKGSKIALSKGDSPPSHALGRGIIQARGRSMQWLAEYLSRELRSAVTDKTDLAGNYDFKLEWYNDAESVPEGDPMHPSFFVAIQEQLGLKLTATKGTVRFLVVDRLERPSEN
jgi:uncharacterized protein (TIGR03435 family)